MLVWKVTSRTKVWKKLKGRSSKNKNGRVSTIYIEISVRPWTVSLGRVCLKCILLYFLRISCFNGDMRKSSTWSKPSKYFFTGTTQKSSFWQYLTFYFYQHLIPTLYLWVKSQVDIGVLLLLLAEILWVIQWIVKWVFTFLPCKGVPIL